MGRNRSVSCFQSTPALSLAAFLAKEILICIWARHFATLVSRLQQKLMVNALPICVILSQCLPVIFSAPLKSTWKSSNFITLLVHTVRVLDFYCSVNQPVREGQIMWGRAPRLFPTVVFSWTSIKKASFFLYLAITRCYCVWVIR